LPKPGNYKHIRRYWEDEADVIKEQEHGGSNGGVDIDG
jgi:hypothetical protein